MTQSPVTRAPNSPVKTSNPEAAAQQSSVKALPILNCTPMPNHSLCSYGHGQVDSFVHQVSGRKLQRTVAVVFHEEPAVPAGLMRPDHAMAGISAPRKMLFPTPRSTKAPEGQSSVTPQSSPI